MWRRGATVVTAGCAIGFGVSEWNAALDDTVKAGCLVEALRVDTHHTPHYGRPEVFLLRSVLKAMPAATGPVLVTGPSGSGKTAVVGEAVPPSSHLWVPVSTGGDVGQALCSAVHEAVVHAPNAPWLWRLVEPPRPTLHDALTLLDTALPTVPDACVVVDTGDVGMDVVPTQADGRPTAVIVDASGQLRFMQVGDMAPGEEESPQPPPPPHHVEVFEWACRTTASGCAHVVFVGRDAALHCPWTVQQVRVRVSDLSKEHVHEVLMGSGCLDSFPEPAVGPAVDTVWSAVGGRVGDVLQASRAICNMQLPDTSPCACPEAAPQPDCPVCTDCLAAVSAACDAQTVTWLAPLQAGLGFDANGSLEFADADARVRCGVLFESAMVLTGKRPAASGTMGADTATTFTALVKHLTLLWGNEAELSRGVRALVTDGWLEFMPFEDNRSHAAPDGDGGEDAGAPEWLYAVEDLDRAAFVQLRPAVRAALESGVMSEDHLSSQLEKSIRVQHLRMEHDVLAADIHVLHEAMAALDEEDATLELKKGIMEEEDFLVAKIDLRLRRNNLATRQQEANTRRDLLSAMATSGGIPWPPPPH